MAPDPPFDRARLSAAPTGASSAEPCSVGLPFPRGLVRSSESLLLSDAGGTALPVRSETLALWPDGSVKWALLEFLAPPEPAAEAVLHVALAQEGARRDAPTVAVERSAAGIEIVGGNAALALAAADGSLSIGPRDAPVALATLRLEGPAGQARARLLELAPETFGPVRARVRARFELSGGGLPGPLLLCLRVGAWAGSGLLGLEVSLSNPAAARHPGGLWDLGDPGSCLVRDLSLHVRLASLRAEGIAWRAEPGHAPEPAALGPLEIRQESSGGANWASRAHVDRDGRVPLRSRGYGVRLPGAERSGLRASPVVSLETKGLRLSAAIEHFWQGFPKAIDADASGLRLRFFPGADAPIELLPGEQKTHRAFLQVEPAGSLAPSPLDWVAARRHFRAEPEWYAASGAVAHLPLPRAPRPEAVRPLYERALDGAGSFHAKREVADEYGWRHFGDVYADHENEHYPGERPVVSHYNNQYDLVLGFLTRALETGDARWFELGRDLARHVADIDLYHTELDRPAYNGGLFWHTDHYDDAHRSAHRTYSADSPRARAGRAYGGGPANEHNYAGGLLLYYYLTGEPAARDAVLSLARWVVAMDDGARTLLGPLDPAPTGLASSTYSPDYHGPGRGAGNSIATLLDGFALTGNRGYLAKAEELIARCVHPADDIEKRELRDLEARWSYLVFLQALGKYLERKLELGERDRAFAYARQSLLAYARWIRDNEVPYRLAFDRVEFPTATWPAHDLRKAVVLAHAARHAPPGERAGLLAAAARFREEAFAGLLARDGHDCTRPLAIVLQNEPLLAAVLAKPPVEAEAGEVDFGAPAGFEPQKRRVMRALRSPGGALRLSLRLAHPARLLAFVRLAAGEARRRWR